METPTEKGYCATCGRSADDVLYNGHADHCYPTPPPAALTPERRTEERWVYSADQTERTMVPPPARAEAPEGELERLRAEVTHYREAALEVGCLDGHFVVQLVQTLRAENTRLNLELEALRKAVVK
jgi:hypothetical protein